MKIAMFIFIGHDDESNEDCFQYQEQNGMFGSDSWLLVSRDDYSRVETIIKDLIKDGFTVVTNSSKVMNIMERNELNG